MGFLPHITCMCPTWVIPSPCPFPMSSGNFPSLFLSSFIFFYFIFLVVLGIELRATHMLGYISTLFLYFYFEKGLAKLSSLALSLRASCLSLPNTVVSWFTNFSCFHDSGCRISSKIVFATKMQVYMYYSCNLVATRMAEQILGPESWKELSS